LLAACLIAINASNIARDSGERNRKKLEKFLLKNRGTPYLLTAPHLPRIEDQTVSVVGRDGLEKNETERCRVDLSFAAVLLQAQVNLSRMLVSKKTRPHDTADIDTRVRERALQADTED
jgi:hypothetical protein